jgi:hypothetical protein
MPSNVPLARKMLEDLLIEVAMGNATANTICDTITQSLVLMHQDPYKRRAPNQRRRLDASDKAQIDVWVKTTMDYAEMAAKLGVNTGRISEYVNGLS